MGYLFGLVKIIALLFGLAVLLVGGGLWYAIVFPRQPHVGPLPPLTGAEAAMTARLRAHISAVASEPHNIAHPKALEASATYIEKSLSDLGYTVLKQTFRVDGRDVRNIEVVIEPEQEFLHPATIVVGAHYDSAHDIPGANDNGTGVAATLELARSLRALKPKTHRLRLAFWVNEEPPYFKSPNMGSHVHAKSLSEAGENIVGMISLETLGFFSERPGSQVFPWPFGYIYSDVGNFVAFVGLPGSRSFLRDVIKNFRRETRFPSIGGLAPGFVPGIDLSDHWSFHQFGFPALMITDTAPFRNPYYHQRNDLPRNVDYQSLARITAGLERMLRQLAR